MRVTNQMVTNRYINDLQTSKENLLKVQGQMTSEKEINKPSDDPAKVVKIMQMNSDINANTQYATNIDDASNYLGTADPLLDKVTSILQRVREILVSSGSAATDNTASKNEINQDIGELGQILNTKSGGKYIFGGASGNTAPVTIIPAVLPASPPTIPYDHLSQPTDGGKLLAQVSSGVSMDYSISALDIIGPIGASNNISDVLKIIQYHLDGENSNGVVDSTAAAQLTGADLTNITDAITNITTIRSKEGTTINILDDIKQKNTDESANLTDMLSKTQGIDIAEKTMEYTNMQNVYTATLQISSKIIQPSLMDYLK